MENELKEMSIKITKVKEEMDQKISQNVTVFGSVKVLKQAPPLMAGKPLPEINIEGIETPTTIRIADLTPKPEPVYVRTIEEKIKDSKPLTELQRSYIETANSPLVRRHKQTATYYKKRNFLLTSSKQAELKKQGKSGLQKQKEKAIQKIQFRIRDTDMVQFKKAKMKRSHDVATKVPNPLKPEDDILKRVYEVRVREKPVKIFKPYFKKHAPIVAKLKGRRVLSPVEDTNVIKMSHRYKIKIHRVDQRDVQIKYVKEICFKYLPKGYFGPLEIYDPEIEKIKQETREKEEKLEKKQKRKSHTENTI